MHRFLKQFAGQCASHYTNAPVTIPMHLHNTNAPVATPIRRSLHQCASRYTNAPVATPMRRSLHQCAGRYTNAPVATPMRRSLHQCIGHSTDRYPFRWIWNKLEEETNGRRSKRLEEIRDEAIHRNLVRKAQLSEDAKTLFSVTQFNCSSSAEASSAKEMHSYR